MAKSNAKLTPLDLYIQAGIDPKTGLPIKMASSKDIKGGMRKIIRVIDEQDAVNRYVWYNLPCNISSQELERLLYYKGQLILFYLDELDSFYFMPYALDGTIDFYGRFNRVHPVPMASGKDDDAEKERMKAQEAVLSKKKYDVVYGIADAGQFEPEELKGKCVILRDYTPQFNAQSILPRATINDALVDLESEMLPMMRTALLAGSGVKGMRVNDADQALGVREASKGVHGAAMSGDLWIPLIGGIDFQELADGSLAKVEEYLVAFQSLDNLRLGTLGIENGGLFEKKAHVLEAEEKVNGSSVSPVMQDGLAIRQAFCNIANSLWDLGMWCMPSEAVMETDVDLDGDAIDGDEDGAHSGVEGE